ncbi:MULTISPECIES: hypothetical protein [unclassified Frankia]|nr:MULTISPECIES: hypothetical protein [unclassified Frankia]
MSRPARAAFDIPDEERAVCLVGGWWPYKDIAAIHPRPDPTIAARPHYK